MATPSGTIAASDINTELGRASGTSLNMNERVIRQLANSVTNANMSPASTSISFDNLRNKSREQVQTLSSGSRFNREAGIENINWNTATFARIDIAGNDWTPVYGGGVTTDSLDVQFDPTSALRADPSNWAITSSGATYGIRVTISGSSRNIGLGSRLLVGFFDRSGINSTWTPPDRPVNYGFITEHTGIQTFQQTETSFTISSEIVAENLNNSLQGPSPLAWTLSRLKTYGANNYFSVICEAYPFSGSSTSLVKIDSISITVKTQIN